MDYFKDFINTDGYPNAISSFLLIRVDRKLEQLNNALIELIEIVLKQDK